MALIQAVSTSSKLSKFNFWSVETLLDYFDTHFDSFDTVGIIEIQHLKRRNDRSGRREEIKRISPATPPCSAFPPPATFASHAFCNISALPLEDWTTCMKMIWQMAKVPQWTDEIHPVGEKNFFWANFVDFSEEKTSKGKIYEETFNFFKTLSLHLKLILTSNLSFFKSYTPTRKRKAEKSCEKWKISKSIRNC